MSGRLPPISQIGNFSIDEEYQQSGSLSEEQAPSYLNTSGTIEDSDRIVPQQTAHVFDEFSGSYITKTVEISEEEKLASRLRRTTTAELSRESNDPSSFRVREGSGGSLFKTVSFPDDGEHGGNNIFAHSSHGEEPSY